MRGPEQFLRKTFHQAEAGHHRFNFEKQEKIIAQGKQFVAEVLAVTPEAAVDEQAFRHLVPKANQFANPDLANNPHAYHTIRHTDAVFGMGKFLVPFINNEYKTNLSMQAVDAATRGHDLMRQRDILGFFPPQWYKRHGDEMAEQVASGKAFPELTPTERAIAATAIRYHDVDPRKPHDRNPEDELLAIIDREELVRLTHGVGPIARMGFPLFMHRQHAYTSFYFPGLAEKIRPLSQALFILSQEGLRNGLGQEESVIAAMQELGMMQLQENPVVAPQKEATVVY